MSCDLWQSSETGLLPGYNKGVDTDVAMSERFERLVRGQLPALGEGDPAADACPIDGSCGQTDISVELALLAQYLQTEEFQTNFLAFVAGKGKK